MNEKEIADRVRALLKEALEQEKKAMDGGDFNGSTWWCAKVNAYYHVLKDVLGENAEVGRRCRDCGKEVTEAQIAQRQAYQVPVRKEIVYGGDTPSVVKTLEREWVHRSCHESANSQR